VRVLASESVCVTQMAIQYAKKGMGERGGRVQGFGGQDMS